MGEGRRGRDRFGREDGAAELLKNRDTCCFLGLVEVFPECGETIGFAAAWAARVLQERGELVAGRFGGHSVQIVVEKVDVAQRRLVPRPREAQTWLRDQVPEASGCG